MATKGEITQLLSILGIAYPRHVLEGEKLVQAVPVWHELLGDLDLGLLEAAAHKHCTTSQWFPSIAEIRLSGLDLIQVPDGIKNAGEAREDNQSPLRQNRLRQLST